MKKIIVSVILTICILIGTLTGASASVMIVSSTNAYDDSDAMYANLDRAIAALNNQVIVKGKSFSFNEVVGPRTAENGFAAAPNGNGISVMGGGVSQIATTLHMAMKNLGGDIVNEALYSFGTAYNAGYVESAAETVLTDYSRKLDYRFTSNHAENLAISMWRSDDMIFCQLTGIGNATMVPTDEPEVAPSPAPDKPDVPVASVQKMKVVNVNSYVNLREAASTKSESLMQIPKDAVVECTGEQDGDFLKVSYEGKTGYVHGKYLEKVEETEPVMMEVVNCKKCVTLRKEASKKAAALADVPLGAKVEYTGVSDGEFHKVIYLDMTGYVLKIYLTQI